MLLAVLAGCGTKTVETGHGAAAQAIALTTARGSIPSAVSTHPTTDLARTWSLARWDQARWWGAVEVETAKSQGKSCSNAGCHPSWTAAVSATSGANCGGSDYPPCYVAQRESGNTYGAYNPNGCGGSGCYGRWQFGGFWACKLGLPCDLSSATPEQQDNAARLLWNHGAGCSNWAAC